MQSCLFVNAICYKHMYTYIIYTLQSSWIKRSIDAFGFQYCIYSYQLLTPRSLDLFTEFVYMSYTVHMNISLIYLQPRLWWKEIK